MSLFDAQNALGPFRPVGPPPLRLFGSHSWDHRHHRDGLHQLIDTRWRKNVHWIDLAVPREHPLHVTGGAALERALFARLQRTEVLLAFAGMYSSYSPWIEFEVETAFYLGVPIIAVKPRSQKQLSSVVMDHCTFEVGWNGKSVREAILDCLPDPRWAALAPILRRSESVEEMCEILGIQ